MNISLTKQELVMLLRLANIGDWVMFADLEGDERDNPTALAHKKVMQKLFAAAHKAKMEKIVFCDKTSKEYYETKEFEEDYLQFVDAFKDQQFWEVLSDRLAERDLVEKIGEKAFDAMDWIDRGGKLYDLSLNYEDEFEKHGLERLHLLNTMKGGIA